MTGSLTHTVTQRRTSDLVWDGGLHATVYVDNAPPLQAGADVGWTRISWPPRRSAPS